MLNRVAARVSRAACASFALALVFALLAACGSEPAPEPAPNAISYTSEAAPTIVSYTTEPNPTAVSYTTEANPTEPDPTAVSYTTEATPTPGAAPAPFHASVAAQGATTPEELIVLSSTVASSPQPPRATRSRRCWIM